jgi:hypothetical protein
MACGSCLVGQGELVELRRGVACYVTPAFGDLHCRVLQGGVRSSIHSEGPTQSKGPHTL